MPTLYASLYGPEKLFSARTMAVIVGTTLLLTLSAKIKVPFYPAPMTMQTLVVLGIGLTLGWRLAGLCVGAYLLEGALGFPVFAGTPERGIGLQYMMGPTGGYLLGFFCAATLCGWLAERGWDRGIATSFAAAILGTLLIYIPGVLWLGVLLGWDKPLLEWGVLPFLAGDAVKAAIIAIGLPLIRRRYSS